MSDRVSGRSRRVSLTSRIAPILGALALVAGPAAPIVGAAGGLTITTPYPQLVAEPGSTATFKLTLSATPAVTAILSADGVPSGWTSRFRGGGTEIGSVFIPNTSPTATNAPDVQFSVDIPADAPAGNHTMTLHADAGALQETLPVTVDVQSAAGGSISLTADSPQRKGNSTTSFSFNLTLKNDTPSQATYTWNAQGPDGWTVTVASAGQSQATTIDVAAGSTGSLTASVSPPQNVAAGDYPIVVTASGGGKSAEADMQVTITGSYSLTLATPDGGPLSTTANASSEKDFALLVTNDGTAPITAVTPTATTPSGWTVTFNPTKIDSLAPGAQGAQTLTAQITPSADAIAGDYIVTIKVAGTEGNASASADIRVTVETPQFWWIAGVVLLLLTFAGLYWVFRTYGRR